MGALMLRYFEGVAGTGKTTRLMHELKQRVQKENLNEGQKILAITFMHGSRRRLQQTLSSEESVANRFECLTIDSFAKRISERWRSLLIETGFFPEEGSGIFQSTLQAAAHVTQNSSVRNWISRSYPIIIIDEFQDCSEYHINFISNIEPDVLILAAADEFQDLNSCERNYAIEYLKSVGEGETLTDIHRTKRLGILSAAKLLRNGAPISTACNKRGCGIYLRPAYSQIVATHGVAKHLLWYGTTNVAFLTPTNPDKVPTFKRVIEKLESGPITIKNRAKPIGPYKIKVAVSIESKIDDEIKKLCLIDKKDKYNCIDSENLKINQVSEASKILNEYMRKLKRLKGIVKVDINEAIQHIKKTMLANYNLLPIKTGGIEALTIRQAKNREFESVILLWPYSVPPSTDMQRRLLYNGITRAKQQVTILIEDPEKRKNSAIFGTLKWK